MATFRVLEGMLQRHQTLPLDVASLEALANPQDPDRIDATGRLRRVNDQVVINFGKHKGKPLSELATTQPGYLQWILNGDFAATVKNHVEEALGQDRGSAEQTEDDQSP